jgi:hypothetical protein
MGSMEQLGWLSADGRERKTELGVGAPMATGRSGSELAEGASACEMSRLPFYRRRALDRGNGGTGGSLRVAG